MQKQKKNSINCDSNFRSYCAFFALVLLCGYVYLGVGLEKSKSVIKKNKERKSYRDLSLLVQTRVPCVSIQNHSLPTQCDSADTCRFLSLSLVFSDRSWALAGRRECLLG